MSNNDEKAKNNFTIEMRIFENYEKVRHEIIKAIEIQKYYVFFYEVRKGRRILGKGRIKEILDIIL